MLEVKQKCLSLESNMHDQIEHIQVEDEKSKDSKSHNNEKEGTEMEIERRWTHREIKDRTKITKNVVAISCSFAFLFTSFHSMANLQSSINKTLGTTSLWTLYASLLVSCAFLPSFLISVLKLKWTLAVSMLSYSAYMVSQYYPTYYTMIPAAILLGLGAAPMWSAKCTYLAQAGEIYGDLVGQPSEVTITKFFGIFFLFFQSSHIIGNLISSSVFSDGVHQETVPESFLHRCGANYCPGVDLSDDSIAFNSTHMEISEDKRVILSSIYLTFSLLSAAVVALFVDPLSEFGVGEEEWNFECKGGLNLLTATFRHLKNPYQALLIPLTVWSGLQQAYLAADFTVSFITCGLGVHMVGYVMICYGAMEAISSLSLSSLVKLLGRVPVFVFGAIINVSMIFLMLNWAPQKNDSYIYFIIAGLWGIGDSVWQTQMNALYGVIFFESPEAAFSNYRLWESLGFMLGYFLCSLLCVQWKLYLNLCVLSLGMAGYLCVEAMESLWPPTTST